METRWYSWLNREYTVIETRKKRTNSMLCAVIYLLGLISTAFWLPEQVFIDTLTPMTPELYGYIQGTLLELPLVLLGLMVSIWMIVLLMIPPIIFMYNGDKLLDLDYPDNPERTARWRKRKADRAERKANPKCYFKVD